MRELRAAFNEIIVAVQVDCCSNGCEDAATPDVFTDQLLALLPKPTVRVKCQECGGSGKVKNWIGDIEQVPKLPLPCPSCTDGWNEHEIVWEKGIVAADGGIIDMSEILTLPDLKDRDVREASVGLQWVLDTGEKGSDFVTISHNKGTLRIGEKV